LARLADTSARNPPGESSQSEVSTMAGANPPPPPRRTMGDYCRRTDARQISMGFQPENPVTFDIKNTVLTGLRDNQF
ncbi:hypothetical protein A2U01_0097094, partial [Trifolium medium]|nr:hypothetical protein [Trifolium medium]